jgi:CHAP domain
MNLLRPSKVKATAFAAMAMIATTSIVSQAPANAAAVYVVTGAGPGLVARSGPGTNFPMVGVLPNNSAQTIDCQVLNGTSVGGNRTWNRLTNGSFAADYFFNTPSFNNYAPGLGPCGTTPPPSNGGATATSQAAHNYAAARVGAVTIPVAERLWNTNAINWSGWCELFVYNAYNSGAGAGIPAYASAKARGDANAYRLNPSQTPPAGAIVLWDATPTNSYGHVAIATGNGAEVIGTLGYYGQALPVSRYQISYAPNYRGWYIP